MESCLAIMMLCLILFGLLQVSYLIAAKDVISFSAFAACRSATVGMRDEFVSRVVRTTSIPTAGPTLNRGLLNRGMRQGKSVGTTWDSALQATPTSNQYWVEKYCIPYYLGADVADLAYWLNYYNWINTDTMITSSSARSGDSVEVYVQQYVPLSFPFARAFYRGNMGNMTRPNGVSSVPRSPIKADLQMEDHSALYLTGQ